MKHKNIFMAYYCEIMANTKKIGLGFDNQQTIEARKNNK